MLRFEKNVEDRKVLVKRLGELTGIHPMYMRTPTYAFVCGDYTVDREGYLLIDEEKADAGILTALMEEGLITGGEVVGADATEPLDEVAVETAEAAEQQEESDTAEDEAAQEEPPAEAADTDDSDPVPDEEYGQETAEEAAANENAIDLNMDLPLPIGRHTGTSLRNLVNLIYSRGALVNKATGGHFGVDEELVEKLKDDACTYSKANFFKMVGDYEAQHGKSLHGLTITPEEVRFTGFGKAKNMEHLTAFGHLAVLMNEQAINQKRIQAKSVDDSNEKYAMRIWLVRIGMGGDEFKQTRKILMENLGGHTAFRTPKDAEKAKEKAQRKRDALRAAKAAAVEGTAGGTAAAV